MTSAVHGHAYIFSGPRDLFDNGYYDEFPRASESECREFEESGAANRRCSNKTDVDQGSYWYCSRLGGHAGPHIGMADPDEGGDSGITVIVVARWFSKNYVHVIHEESSP